MQNISEEELKTEKIIFFNKIKEGTLFIHPTDTIYGIGCNATNHKSVYRVRESKERYTAPFSVIAPSKDWIRQNCEVNEKVEEWLDKLPGPYTLILKLKDKGAIAPNVNMDMDTLGVRIPDHWFSEVVAEIGIPIVTTSANITKSNFMTSEEDLDPKITSKIDFMIYEGEKHGKPSRLVDLTKDDVDIIER
jgi:tRNA threonylcarbamoyl adenosine modification protein (Sua5/YciO/YrdC/YwlC family)